MIYELTFGTSPDTIYGTETEISLYLLLENGGFFLLEDDGFILLELSTVIDSMIYGETSGTNPSDIFDNDSGAGSTLFENTSGTNADPIYEED